MQDRTLTLIEDDGREIVCDILFTYHWEKLNKDYVVFQVRGAQGEVSAAVYYPTDGGQGRLEKVETDEEWDMLEDLLDDYSNSLEDEESSYCSGCSGCGNGSSCGGCSGCGE